jgi:hypothetical protein
VASGQVGEEDQLRVQSEDEWEEWASLADMKVGLGRIVALYYRPSTSYRIR